MDVNSRNVPEPTFSRSEGSHHNLVQLLLEYGTELNPRDNNGAIALHYASLMWDLEVARVLLNHGANVNVEDKPGLDPIAPSVGSRELL